VNSIVLPVSRLRPWLASPTRLEVWPNSLSHIHSHKVYASDLHQFTVYHTISMTQIIEEEPLADADAAEKGPYDQFILLSVYNLG